jgi:PAS domain S-box-containing protein/putative nucleotidyltransferase with HDIG domain
MKNDKDKLAEAAELRRLTEERLREKRKSQRSEVGGLPAITLAKAGQRTKEETQRLLHELQVHQVELEMQNEELRQAQAEMEAGLERYTDLHNFAPVGCFSLDRNGAISQVNLTGASLLGIERSRLVNRRFGLFVSDESRPAFNAFLKKVFENQAKETYEVALRTDGNEPVWVHIEATASEDGQACRAAVVDITERKRAEEELRKSEERFKLIFEYAPDAYYLNDLKGNFIDGNKAAEKTTGYKREELIGGSFLKLNLLPLDQLPKAAKLLANNAMGRPTGPDEFILNRKSGDKVPVEISTHPVKFENRTVVLGIARDITERMRTEEARRQAEENFRRSMNESPLGIRIVSAKGETLYANRAILDIYGYKDIEELKSTPVKNRYTPESYAEYQSRKKKRMNGEDYSSEYEISIIRKTGENRRLRVFRKEILWNGQKQFQAIYQDITDRKRAEEQLQKSLQQTKKVLEEVVWTLSLIVEKRDPYTAGHQCRVAELACAIAGELNLPEVQIEGIRVAGLIHDIGKMNVPAEILSKTGRLSEAEFNLIRTHAQVGKEILESIDFPWPVAQIVHQHHERLNGTGYPHGLSAEKIILEAKIIAVADVVEAMASHRPYRPALGVEKALEEISSQRDLLYDLQVVDGCRELFGKKGYKLA